MNSKIQVFSFFVSFVYGCFFYMVARFNRNLLKNKNMLFKLFVTTVLVIDVVILYIYIMYKINLGMIHPYFIVMVIIGFIFVNKFYDKIMMILENFLCKVIVKNKGK